MKRNGGGGILNEHPQISLFLSLLQELLVEIYVRAYDRARKHGYHLAAYGGVDQCSWCDGTIHIRMCLFTG